MFIQTEDTPNPDVLKFHPGREISPESPRDFPSSGDAEGVSPLAVRLFGLAGVRGVFLGKDFVSVTRDPETDWPSLKVAVLSAIMDHFMSGEPVLHETHGAGLAEKGEKDDDPLVLQIRELLDTRVRPAVAADGGDVEFVAFEDGIVYLAMRGACSGCPSATMTLKMGIENLLKHYVPEVLEVRPAEEM